MISVCACCLPVFVRPRANPPWLVGWPGWTSPPTTIRFCAILCRIDFCALVTPPPFIPLTVNATCCCYLRFEISYMPPLRSLVCFPGVLNEAAMLLLFTEEFECLWRVIFSSSVIRRCRLFCSRLAASSVRSNVTLDVLPACCDILFINFSS